MFVLYTCKFFYSLNSSVTLSQRAWYICTASGVDPDFLARGFMRRWGSKSQAAAQMTKAGVKFLRRGSQPPVHQVGGLGSAVSSAEYSDISNWVVQLLSRAKNWSTYKPCYAPPRKIPFINAVKPIYGCQQIALKILWFLYRLGLVLWLGSV